MLRAPVLVLITTLCAPAVASVSSELERAFTNLGGLGNTTSASAYKAQSAGYYNGGSLYLRTPVHNTQLANVTLPSFTGGCSGIDLHFGGFSYISKSQAQELAKDIMSDSASYAFNLALETLSPMIATTFKDLRNVINAVNRSNINSCETAVGLVGAMAPKTKAAQKAVCQDVGAGSGGVFGDYTSARMGCGNGGQMSNVLESANSQKGYEKTLASNMNFAWKAIKSNAFLASNDDVAELFMSITGTVVVKHEGNDDSENNEVFLPSLVGDESLLSALLHGGAAASYSCDTKGEDGCLNPSKNNLSLNKSDSLVYRIENTINNIVTKIKTDEGALTEAEKAFLQSTRLPIYKMVNVQSAFTKDRSVLDVASYSELIASDVLFKYLDETISLVDAEYQMLQIPTDKKEQFQESIRLARDKVKELKQDNYRHQMISAQLIEQTMLIEKMLANNLEKMDSSNRWAESL